MAIINVDCVRYKTHLSPFALCLGQGGTIRGRDGRKCVGELRYKGAGESYHHYLLILGANFSCLLSKGKSSKLC